MIDFDRLEFGETTALDMFYNADIALVDFTVTQQQPSLCYHVGVRESMGQQFNIIIMYMHDESTELRTVDTIKRIMGHLDMLVYFQPQDGGKYLLSTERNSKMDPRNDR